VRGWPPEPRRGNAGTITPAGAPITIADEFAKGRRGSEADSFKIGDRVIALPSVRPVPALLRLLHDGLTAPEEAPALSVALLPPCTEGQHL
jgi:hypothetical protein